LESFVKTKKIPRSERNINESFVGVTKPKKGFSSVNNEFECILAFYETFKKICLETPKVRFEQEQLYELRTR
jgi:hypothetical protein